VAEIAVHAVRKTFDRGRVAAVGGAPGPGALGPGVDLTVRDGELFVLLGPSGCGKTTLLRMIAGLESADSGTITIGGRDVTGLPPRKRDLAMVFQNYAVFPHLTVEQNIGFGLRMKGGTDSAAVARKVRWAADLVDLGDLLARRPAQLSGGQRQRVAVARALAVEPSVLLMDEPLSNLDALLRLKFRSDLKRIVHEVRTTVIYVTHDQVEALSLADRLAVMKDGQIVQVGLPLSVYDRPATTFVGGFLGSPPMNFLPMTSDGKKLLAGIRGENLQILGGEQAPTGGQVVTGEPGGLVQGRVVVVEPLGSSTLVTVLTADAEVKVVAPADYTAAPDAELWLRPAPGKIRWYDPGTGNAVT
jgi:multiple sugar transport system ATP-binding protein